MSPVNVFYAIIFFVLMLAPSSNAADQPLESLDFLEGRWLEKRGENTVVEVVWNPVNGDAMTGTWSRTKNDVLMNYEILTMREIVDDIFYRFDLYGKGDDGLFEKTSHLRLKLLSVVAPIAKFEIVDEKNWNLTMDASKGILRGWMDDTNNPSTEKRYNYFAEKQ